MRAILVHFLDSDSPVFQFIGDSDGEVAFLRDWVEKNLNVKVEVQIPAVAPAEPTSWPEVSVEGYIRLYRKLLQHSVFTAKDEKLFRIFIYCLLRATHKETMVYFNHQDIPLKPGQFITSREHAARDLGYSPKTLTAKSMTCRSWEF